MKGSQTTTLEGGCTCRVVRYRKAMLAKRGA